MSIKESRSLREQMEEAKQQRREQTRRSAKADNDEISLIAEYAARSQVRENAEAAFLPLEVVVEPESSEMQSTIETQPSAVSSPVLTIPTIPLPDPVAQPFRTKRAEDRLPQAPKAEPTNSAQVPPVPLTPEQAELYSWMFLLERYDAMKAAKRDRNVAFWNQCATLVISVLGIVGGTMAIRNGLRAASERDRR